MPQNGEEPRMTPIARIRNESQNHLPFVSSCNPWLTPPERSREGQSLTVQVQRARWPSLHPPLLRTSVPPWFISPSQDPSPRRPGDSHHGTGGGDLFRSVNRFESVGCGSVPRDSKRPRIIMSTVDVRFSCVSRVSWLPENHLSHPCHPVIRG